MNLGENPNRISYMGKEKEKRKAKRENRGKWIQIHTYVCVYVEKEREREGGKMVECNYYFRLEINNLSMQFVNASADIPRGEALWCRGFGGIRRKRWNCNTHTYIHTHIYTSSTYIAALARRYFLFM